MIIAISGNTGTGKTTAAKILATKLGYHYYSMGALRGKLAMDRGITIDELNEMGERDPMSDFSVDEYQKKLGQTENNFVVEGRMSWYFIPQAYKIYLTCDSREAARRIYEARKNAGAERDDEPFYPTVEYTEYILAKRNASDVRRYQSYYKIDYQNPTLHDLVIDTTKNSGPEETVKQILQALKTAGHIF